MNGRAAKALRKAARQTVAARPTTQLEKYAAAMSTWAATRGRDVLIKKSWPLGRNRVVLVLHTPKKHEP